MTAIFILFGLLIFANAYSFMKAKKKSAERSEDNE